MVCDCSGVSAMLILWCGPFRCLYGGADGSCVETMVCDCSGVSAGVDTVVWIVQVSILMLKLWCGLFRCQCRC